MKILGICGTPVKKETNTGYLTEMIMDNCKKQGDDVETEIVRLADMEISGGCNHCNWCLKRQTEEKICAKDDDWTKQVAPKIIKADALVWATPVYLMGVSWLMACYLHRHRAFLEGKYYGLRGKERNGVHNHKPVLSAAVAWVSHGGVETTLQSMTQTAISLGFVPVAGILSLGVGGVSEAPLGEFGAVRKDKNAMSEAQYGAARLVEMVRIIKAGKEKLGI